MTESGSNQRQPWTFSLGSMLMAVTIACLATALFATHRRLADTESQLRSMQPLSTRDVATQFEGCTTVGPISTEVTDVRYSPEDDSYKVRFSWTNQDDGQTWWTDVILKSDGYGSYGGMIRNGPFTKPLGYKNGFAVAVQTPSGLTE